MRAFFQVLVKLAPTLMHLINGLIPVVKENFKKDTDKPQDVYDKIGQLLVLVAFLYWATLFFFGEDITGMLVLVIESFTGQEVSCYGFDNGSSDTLRLALEVAEENEVILREKIAILEEQLKQQQQQPIPHTKPPTGNYGGYLNRL